MNHDTLSTSMFWVGALFVFTPILCAGLVLGIWWWQRRATTGDARGRRPGAFDDNGAG
jgi:hypothetical protein